MRVLLGEAADAFGKMIGSFNARIERSGILSSPAVPTGRTTAGLSGLPAGRPASAAAGRTTGKRKPSPGAASTPARPPGVKGRFDRLITRTPADTWRDPDFKVS